MPNNQRGLLADGRVMCTFTATGPATAVTIATITVQTSGVFNITIQGSVRQIEEVVITSITSVPTNLGVAGWTFSAGGRTVTLLLVNPTAAGISTGTGIVLAGFVIGYS